MRKLIATMFIAIIFLSSCAIKNTPQGSKIEVSSSSVSGFSGGSFHSLTSYTLKKGNEPEVVFNGRNLIKAVKDNPSALSHARAFRILRTVSKISFATFFIGTTYGIFGRESNKSLAKTSLTVGLVSFPIIFISGPIAIGHANKSIKVYNGF